MAFKRKRLRNEDGSINHNPAKCHYCGEIKALWSLHGGYSQYSGGKRCCDDCFPKVQELGRKEEKRSSNEMSEGDYQSWGKL
ncbi:hypothetical protein [Bacillus sp. JCM 19041]|uniref:hypothetical protein n=1 Tax=Bacillus sp. JCM 19041 TaxID=1460637 RepID=UPI0006D25912